MFLICFSELPTRRMASSAIFSSRTDICSRCQVQRTDVNSYPTILYPWSENLLFSALTQIGWISNWSTSLYNSMNLILNLRYPHRGSRNLALTTSYSSRQFSVRSRAWQGQCSILDVGEILSLFSIQFGQSQANAHPDSLTSTCKWPDALLHGSFQSEWSEKLLDRFRPSKASGLVSVS